MRPGSGSVSPERKETTMRSQWINGAGFLLLLGGVVLTGCCQQEKEQIAALTNQNEVLTAQNSDLRDQVSELENSNAQFRAEINQKDRLLLQKNQTISQMEQKLAAQPAPAPQDRRGDWDIGAGADKVSLGSDILFAPGRATLTKAGQRKLDAIIGELKNRYDGMPVRVFGYTDSDPIKKSRKLWKDNLDLSANRAMAVTRYLRERGIDAERIETVAMGATHFQAPNTSKANKAKNRRVDIVVVKTN
jgi:flagellar motor protein MotB